MRLDSVCRDPAVLWIPAVHIVRGRGGIYVPLFAGIPGRKER